MFFATAAMDAEIPPVTDSLSSVRVGRSAATCSSASSSRVPGFLRRLQRLDQHHGVVGVERLAVPRAAPAGGDDLLREHVAAAPPTRSLDLHTRSSCGTRLPLLEHLQDPVGHLERVGRFHEPRSAPDHEASQVSADRSSRIDDHPRVGLARRRGATERARTRPSGARSRRRSRCPVGLAAPRAPPTHRSPPHGIGAARRAVARCSARSAPSARASARSRDIKHDLHERRGYHGPTCASLPRKAPSASVSAASIRTKEGNVDNVGKAAVAEFVGTFALIFFGAGAIIMTGAATSSRSRSRTDSRSRSWSRSWRTCPAVCSTRRSRSRCGSRARCPPAARASTSWRSCSARSRPRTS